MVPKVAAEPRPVYQQIIPIVAREPAAVEHVVCAGKLLGFPYAKILVESRAIAEHTVHVGHLLYVP